MGSKKHASGPVRAGSIDLAKTDVIDVTRLAHMAVERKLSVPSSMIQQTMEITARFIARHLDCTTDFQALGYSILFITCTSVPPIEIVTVGIAIVGIAEVGVAAVSITCGVAVMCVARRFFECQTFKESNVGDWFLD